MMKKIVINPKQCDTTTVITALVDAYKDTGKILCGIQIGACDGSIRGRGDSFQQATCGKPWVAAHLVEAVPALYKRLKVAMVDYENVKCYNNVIFTEDEKRKFYSVSEQYAEDFPEAPFWKKYMIGSLDKRGLSRHIPEPYIQDDEIDCLSPKSFLSLTQTKPEELNLLMIDVEGIDGVIISAFMSIPECRPELIIYENKVMPVSERQQVASLLNSLQYKTIDVGADTICLQPHLLAGDYSCKSNSKLSMKKVCIIGNSYTASLIKGWELLKSEFEKEIDLTFFCANGVDFRPNALKYSDRYLYADDAKMNAFFKLTSAGQQHIFLGHYDYFVLNALSINLNNLVMLYIRFRAERHSHQTVNHCSVSNECFDSASSRIFNVVPGLEIFKLLKQHTSKEVLIIISPFPTKEIGKHRKIWADLLNFEDVISFKNYFVNLVKQAFPEKTILIFPPPELLDAPITTIESYTNHAPKLEKQEQFKDAIHMNGDYGKIVIQNLIQRINTVAERRE